MTSKLLIFLLFLCSCHQTPKGGFKLNVAATPMSAYQINLDNQGGQEVLLSLLGDNKEQGFKPLSFFIGPQGQLKNTANNAPSFTHLRNVYSRGKHETIFLDHGVDDKEKSPIGGHVWSYNSLSQEWKQLTEKKRFYFAGDYTFHKGSSYEVRVGLNFIELFINDKEIPLTTHKAQDGFISAKFFTAEEKLYLLLGPRDTLSRAQNRIFLISFHDKQPNKIRPIPLPTSEYGVVEIIEQPWDKDQQPDFTLLLHNVGFSRAAIGKLTSSKNYQFEWVMEDLNKPMWISDWQYLSNSPFQYFRVHPSGRKEDKKHCGVGRLQEAFVTYSSTCILGFLTGTKGTKKVLTSDFRVVELSKLKFNQDLFDIKK